jgi:hypothetical protein
MTFVRELLKINPKIIWFIVMQNKLKNERNRYPQ